MERTNVDAAITVALKKFTNKDFDLALSRTQSLNDDLGIDSLARIDLVVGLERALGILIPESALAVVVTIDDLINVAMAAGNS
jgi:acyl carrier protein